MVKRLLRAVLLGAVCVSLSCGCSKSGKPMPLTKGNVTCYLRKTEAAIKGISPGEIAAAKGSEEKQKQVMYTCFIAPMEGMGYSYDKTISDIAGKVLAKRLATADADTTVMLRHMLSFADKVRDTEYKHGFISKSTKELLDKVSLILPG